MKTNATYTTTVELDPETGEYILTLPDEMMAELGWGPGTMIEFEVVDDGTIIIRQRT